ncbi:hypothetical protein like AT4G32020 [Hibiscus trionum]|uniref:Uncharacterized protein n=1 Tax=Hibiscus trionum TaxID=183268 RepID=A0A9W7IHB5_HIBTR|nr:hypothetical protein like AT4G32020 [Hibiscus trionum]
MGVAVLNPQDCFKLPNPTKHPRNPRRTPNRTQSNRRKRSPNSSPPSRPTVGHPKAPAKNLVMGQVKILKRGEDLKESKPVKPTMFEHESDDADLGSTDCLGPDPVSVPAQIQPDESKNSSHKVLPVSFYAGSAFITSPPPSSVPFPAFFSKKIMAALEDDVATSALRRMLRLES